MVGPAMSVWSSRRPAEGLPDDQLACGAATEVPERESPAERTGLSVLLFEARAPYIIPSIPPMPPGGIAGPSSFFGFSATVASVVISNPAIDDAF